MADLTNIEKWQFERLRLRSTRGFNNETLVHDVG
jgi:hypothetical protein